MNTSTCKSNFLNGLIVHILIFIFISPWEPKQMFDYLAMATGHYPFHVVQIISKEAACVASCFLDMVVGRCPRHMAIPIFRLQISCFFLSICVTLFFLCFHRAVSVNHLSRTQKLLKVSDEYLHVS